MSKRHIIIAALTASLCVLPACGGAKPTESQPAASDAEETSEAQATDSQAAGDSWYNLIDWSQCQASDAPLVFEESAIEAPLTFENLAAAGTESEVEAKDEAGNESTIAFADLAESDLRPDNPNGYGSMYHGASIKVDGRDYTLEFWDTSEEKTFRELVAANQFALYREGMWYAMGVGELEDPEDGRGDAYIFEALCEKYGRPAWVEFVGDSESSPTVFWERDGYKFGVLLFDLSAQTSGPFVETKAFYYFNDSTWDAYVNVQTSDTKYDIHIVPFDEFIAQ